jgi:hypothetical protein
MKRIAILAAAIALMLPGSALANSSTCQAYNPQTCVVSNGPTASTSSTLPFTGINVGLLAAGGATLVGAGLIVRRFSRRVS